MAVKATFIYMLISLLIIPLIIIGLILIYRAMYRRHVNHALNGETSQGRFIEPFNFVIVLLLIVVTIFSIINYTSLKIQNQDLLNNIGSLRSYFNINMNSLSSQVDELETKLNEMEERTRWVTEKSYDYDYNELSVDKYSLMVDLQFSLKTFDPTSQIYLLIIDKEDVSLSKKVSVENNGFLTYQQSVELSLDKNYSIEVLTENGVLNQKEKLFDLDLKNYFSNRVNYKVGGRSKEFDLALFNNYYGIEGFKLAKISYNLYDGDTLRETKDITNELIRSSNTDSESFKYHGTISFNYDQMIMIELVVIDQTGRTITLSRQSIY